MTRTGKHQLGMSADGKPLFAPLEPYTLLRSGCRSGKSRGCLKPAATSAALEKKICTIFSDPKGAGISSPDARLSVDVFILDDFGLFEDSGEV